MLGFAAAGLVAQTLFLVYRAVHAAGPPLSSEFRLVSARRLDAWRPPISI